MKIILSAALLSLTIGNLAIAEDTMIENSSIGNYFNRPMENSSIDPVSFGDEGTKQGPKVLDAKQLELDDSSDEDSEIVAAKMHQQDIRTEELTKRHAQEQKPSFYSRARDFVASIWTFICFWK